MCGAGAIVWLAVGGRVETAGRVEGGEEWRQPEKQCRHWCAGDRCFKIQAPVCWFVAGVIC